MSKWPAKRFWKEVKIKQNGTEFAVLLDCSPLSTPGKSQVLVPTKELATQIAAEWASQEDLVDPLSMPFTRMTNTAIDKVSLQASEVVQHLTAYAETDHLCYRADCPPTLVKRQVESWDPLLDWAKDTFNAPLNKAIGVIYVDQPIESILRLKRRITRLSAFELAAVHDLICLSGSFVAALAVIYKKKPAEEIWELCRIDETWQIEQWGKDTEEEATTKQKMADFLHAASYFSVLAYT